MRTAGLTLIHEMEKKNKCWTRETEEWAAAIRVDGCETGPEMMVSDACLEAETELSWTKSCNSVLGNSETFQIQSGAETELVIKISCHPVIALLCLYLFCLLE